MSLGRMGGRAAQAPERAGRAVSQENVETVLALQEAIGEKDFVQLFRDDYEWGRFSETVAALFHPDFESANVLLGVETTYQGVDGLRAIWLDWLRPWASYRSRVEKIIDCGDRVAVVHRASGCPLGSTQKVMLNSAFVFTLGDGKIVRCEGYPDRAEALKAVGLEDEAVSQENVEKLREIYELMNTRFAALKAGDIDDLVAYFHPEVVIEAVDGPDPETYHGHDGVRRWFNETFGPWAAIHIEAEDIKESGQWTIAVVRTSLRAEASGVELELTAAFFHQFRDGRIVRDRLYLDHDEGLAAFAFKE